MKRLILGALCLIGLAAICLLGVLLAVNSIGALPLSLLIFLLSMLPLMLVFYLVFLILSCSVEQRERPRLFLELLERGWERGESAEETIVSAARCRDQALGVWFYLGAAYVEAGRRFHEMLALVPQLVPRPMNAMLGLSEHGIALPRVLPACRRVLADAISRQHRQLNWQPLLFVGTLPLCGWILAMMEVSVLPKFNYIMDDLVAGEAPGFWFRTVFDHSGVIYGISIFVVVCLAAAIFMMTHGPAVEPWLHWALGTIYDRCLDLLPWKRLRARRNFAVILGLLLDGGVEEGTAVGLAAECSGHRMLEGRASIAREDLRRGARLQEAMKHFDKRGELQWRISNAAASGLGIGPSLEGWCAALEARAFSQEQAFTQLVTALLVLLNGLVVGWLALGTFSLFTYIIQVGVSW